MTKSFEAKARIITGAASEEAKRWLDDKEFDSDAMFAVHEFARHLDQEAQEKCCVLCDGIDCGHLHHQNEKPCDHIWGGYSYPKCVKCGIDVVVREPKAPLESASQLEKPQQPEEIEWHAIPLPDSKSQDESEKAIRTFNRNLITIGKLLERTLNRLTHKD